MKRIAGWTCGIVGALAAACVPDGSHEEPPSIRRSAPDAGFVPSSLPPGPVVSAAVAPPAISGGTLLILRDGKTAFASDPDRDKLYLADLEKQTLLATIPLTAGDEPGRAIEDATGRIHVVLRGGGAIATVDPAARAIGARRPVCAAPRGIAFDPREGVLHVACAEGTLVAMAPDGEAPVRRARLDRDLRDVVVDGERLLISQFRSADLLVVSAADGRLLERRRPPGSRAAQRPAGGGFDGGVRPRTASPIDAAPAAIDASETATGAPAGVAWRLRPLPDGGAAMIHQEGTSGELGTQPGGYGGGPCSAPMGTAVTRFEASRATTSHQLRFTVLPVDFAYSPDGQKVAVVAAGNATIPRNKVSLTLTARLESDTDECDRTDPLPPDVLEFRQPAGDAIAVAFDGAGRVVVQTREPARLEILTNAGGAIDLAKDSRADTGHAIFHAATGNGLACASCHPEGGDDGRVWRFSGLGVRRTQNLRGGISATAPFHWDGDMRDLAHLMQEVFSGRMSGPKVDAKHVSAMAKWMDRLPALPAVPASDPAAVERGRALFNDGRVGCAACHGGPQLTNNQTVAVRLDGARQVPSLRGLAWRAPFMSDGCAPTLADRFARPICGGGDQHGVTSHLTGAQVADLITFLESL